MGRFGRFDPESFAITSSSVERCQFWFDLHVPPQRTVERPTRERPLEAGEAAASVRPAPSRLFAWHEAAVPRDEPQELALWRLASAADAAPDRPGHAAGVSSLVSCSGSTGIPAGTS